MPFRALNLSPKNLAGLLMTPLHRATPIQVAGDPHILAGTMSLASRNRHRKNRGFRLADSDEAGGVDHNGKTRTRALVVAPTRELVVQIEETCALMQLFRCGWPRFYGGVSERPQIAALRSGVDLVWRRRAG